MEELDEKNTIATNYCVPLVWAGPIVTRARKERRINSDHDAVKLMDQLVQFQSCLGRLIGYDWVTVPLVYTQVKCQQHKKSLLTIYEFFTINIESSVLVLGVVKNTES